MASGSKQHTVKSYDEQLSHLRSVVMEMGGLVEEQIQNAIKAFRGDDPELAREVIARDHTVNGLEVKADEEITNLLALRQPMAVDLRLITSLAKVVTDLERIGDEARKIARITTYINERDAPPPKKKLTRDVKSMGKLAVRMLHESLDALARMDVELAVDVARGDEELDAEFTAALRHLYTYVMEDARMVGHTIDITLIVKALERIGDHSKNISEYVIYLVKGTDVRHTDPETIAENVLSED